MDDIADRLSALTCAGFRAVSVELLPDLPVTDRGLVACVRQAREMVGLDMAMLADFGYGWQEWRGAVGSSTSATRPRWMLSTSKSCPAPGWVPGHDGADRPDLGSPARMPARRSVAVALGVREAASVRRTGQELKGTS